MITSLYFLLLIAFQLWYLTSAKVKYVPTSAYQRTIIENRQSSRIIGACIILLSTILFILKLGWMSGICAGLVGLMGVGCLAVLLNPFRYIDEKGLLLLYVLFLILEFTI